MAHREHAPVKAQNHQEVLELVQTMNSNSKKGKGGFSIKRNTFKLPSGRTVDSWRMMDWDYKKPNLPTYARGLFTYVNLDGKQEIAVRGYDKFFNKDEIRKTEWRNVEANTRGPYELSVKENGCIIFISGLDDGTLLVCSKHSTGARADVPLSHAKAGEKWVERHLKTVGKTPTDLARKLREMNATAVAELCDDEFEEHVLAYTPEQAGLYLHGINLNLPEFVTYPGHLIANFAEEWGFKKTMYVMEDEVTKVKSFLDEVAETGVYDGRETEGFVIRCQARETANGPWEDWFFKYKFDEPYLMYRQWREATKAIISGKPPRYKKHKKITEEYLSYARTRLAQDPKLGKQYNMNHGIISLRDDFLKSRGLSGADVIRHELENGEEESANVVTRNVVLVPVATIGCGKTTVALALSKLFDWGHFQNDNVSGKQRRPQRFAESVVALMTPHRAVIADRNNHQKRERQQIMEDVQRVMPTAKFVALQYVHERSNYEQIRKATQDRVFSRGDNHQTIQAGSKGNTEIAEIMEGFLQRFQPVDTNEAPDDMFDLVINLDVAASSRDNLETVVSQLHSTYPKLFPETMPTSDDLDTAIHAALNDYEPDFRMDLGKKSNNTKKQKTERGPAGASGSGLKPPKLEYFGVRLPAQEVNSVLEDIFSDAKPNKAKLYRQLIGSRRIQPGFHVTLIHKSGSATHSEMWDKLASLHAPLIQAEVDQLPAGAGKYSLNNINEPELGRCNVQLERLVWDDRVMCFVVRLLPGGTTHDGTPFEFESTNNVAHVTVGTASPNIKPKESNDLLRRWIDKGSGEETGIQEAVVKGNVTLMGTVKGVLSKIS